MSEYMLDAAARGPECPSCGVPFDEHDGFATMCKKLHADRPVLQTGWIVLSPTNEVVTHVCETAERAERVKSLGEGIHKWTGYRVAQVEIREVVADRKEGDGT